MAKKSTNNDIKIITEIMKESSLIHTVRPIIDLEEVPTLAKLLEFAADEVRGRKFTRRKVYFTFHGKKFSVQYYGDRFIKIYDPETDNIIVCTSAIII